MNVLAFDIETIPDIAAGKRLYNLDGLGDKEVAQAMFALRREQTGESEFLRHYMHRIVAISAVLRRENTLNVWSLGEPDSDEAELIRRFYDGIERYSPTLVTWNGCGFDMPVLHYRTLLHGIPAPRYWENGSDDQSFRWNNYLSRFHERHTDLMDVLSGYQIRATAPLDELAQLLGLPGKLGRHGSEVWSQFLEGKIGEIRDYCEFDALNTYLIYLRYELMRGRLDQAGWQRECDLVRKTLREAGKPHLKEFLEAWK